MLTFAVMIAERKSRIGFFDSGYGGLTILKEVVAKMPDYDYVYLGDNARAPYGSRSFETVYEYTLECVKKLFEMNCELVVLACNTASAKALRSIQQKDLPTLAPHKRVLGVIRPTTEIISSYTKTNKVGVLATSGTVSSQSYVIEINKFSPEVKVFQEACPMWVPLIENNEINNAGADYFFKKHIDNLLNKNAEIDTILLGCTHYPLIIDKIKSLVPKHINVVAQGELVANSLVDYLFRHPEIESKLNKHNEVNFFTTDSTTVFDLYAAAFYGKQIESQHLKL